MPDEKKLYCYTGGKCRCERCVKFRQQMKEYAERNYDEFKPHDRLKLRPTIRHATRLPYRLKASRVSEAMADMLLKHHMKLLEDYPIYYLDPTYYKKCIYKAPGPKDAATQTEARTVKFGIDACPCPNKEVCDDLLTN